MTPEYVVALIIVAASIFVLVRSQATRVASPHDVKLFKARYEARGLAVLAVRRVGTEWIGQRHPIRKYEIDLEGPDGQRETRVRGVSRSHLPGERVWRYNGLGDREPLA